MTRFLILMYHMVSNPEADSEIKYACSPEQFNTHMLKLKQHGFNPVSLEQIEQYLLHNKALPDNAVAITLDDGFADNYTHAFPILSEHQIPATIFLATSCIDSNNRWMNQRGFPTRKMLTWQQILEMNASNISFGAHTVNHVKLPEIDASMANNEILSSKKVIEDKLGQPCKHFAYPYGLFNSKNRDSVEVAGFTLACSTRSGFNNANRDPYVLHRIEVYGNDPWWKLKQKMTFGINDASLFFPAKYYMNRFINRLTP